MLRRTVASSLEIQATFSTTSVGRSNCFLEEMGQRLFVTVTILSVLVAGSFGKLCYDKCMFNFCDHGNFLSVLHSGEPMTKPICKGDEPIGLVTSTGQALLYKSGRFTPISKWSPPGLKQRLAPDLFMAYDFPEESEHCYTSGVGYRVLPEHIDFLSDKCWVLPITSYEVMDEDGFPEDMKPKNPNPYTHCIAFTSRLYYTYTMM